MTRVSAWILALGLAAVSVGCGGGAADTPSAEEEKENQEAMNSDMQNMMGGISEQPGKGMEPTAGGDEAK